MLQKWSCDRHSNCQKTLWTHLKRHLKFVTLDETRKNWPKYFLHWKDCLFSKVCVSNNLFYPKKKFYFHSNCQNTLWTLKSCFPRSVTLDNKRKIRPKSFVTGKMAFFWKTWFPTSQFLKKWSNSLHNICRNTSCALLNCFLTFFPLDILRKQGQNLFSPWQQLIFWNVSSLRSLRTQKTDLINSTKNVKKTLWTLINCSLRFVKLDNSRKNVPQSFLQWKSSLFFLKTL